MTAKIQYQRGTGANP